MSPDWERAVDKVAQFLSPNRIPPMHVRVQAREIVEIVQQEVEDEHEDVS